MSRGSFDTKWETFNPREAFGKAVVELGCSHQECMVLSDDLSRTCCVTEFQSVLPSNFLNVGIAEQNMVGIAAGLALEGRVPIVTAISPFIYLRACEQVRTDVCYNDLHVIFAPVMCGVSGAGLGSTHYGTEDIAVMRSFPNMKVLQPSNPLQVERALIEAYENPGPVYLRLGSGQEAYVPASVEDGIIGKAAKLRGGEDVSILATGYMVHKAVEAAALLEREGLAVGVWDHPSIKPLDKAAVREAALGPSGKVRLVVTLEEHNVYGGFGSAIAEELSSLGSSVPLAILGIPDLFVGVGDREGLLKLHQLDSKSVAERILDRLL